MAAPREIIERVASDRRAAMESALESYRIETRRIARRAQDRTRLDNARVAHWMARYDGARV